MSKHSPGQWVLCDLGDYEDFEHQSRVILSADQSHRIAVVHTDGNKESEANAALIAAAPEMLEALKSLLEDACFATDPDFCECGRFEEGGTCDHVNAAKAIAKAEGRDK